MTKTFYCVEVRLWKVTAEVDGAGARILHTDPVKEMVFEHAVGSLPETQALALYAAVDAVVCGEPV